MSAIRMNRIRMIRKMTMLRFIVTETRVWRGPRRGGRRGMLATDEVVWVMWVTRGLNAC